MHCISYLEQCMHAYTLGVEGYIISILWINGITGYSNFIHIAFNFMNTLFVVSSQ